MLSIKNYWAFPLIGGIIALIGLFTPTAYLTIGDVDFRFNEFDWMWGLFYYEAYDYVFYDFFAAWDFMIYSPEQLILGILIAILILLNGIFIIITSERHRKGKRDFAEIKNNWIVMASLSIALAIIYIVGIEIGFYFYKLRTIGVPVSFWEYRIPHFGIISPFIGGILTIIGVIIGNHVFKREVITLPIKMEVLKPQTSPISVPIKFNFCPECGKKNLIETSRFCTNCGYKFFQT
ncbi:MAG: zinc ribbon domain-containing protein [Candidatus Hodarchaeota archaeon]